MRDRYDIPCTIISYDPSTMTAVAMAIDGTSEWYDCAIKMNSIDSGNGTYSFTPPSNGASCLVSVIGGDPIVKLLYNGAQFDGGKTTPGYNDDTFGNDTSATKNTANINRAPGDAPNRSTLPGDSVVTGPSGSKMGFYDKVWSVKMKDNFYQIMNLLNNFYDILCDRLRLRTPAIDLESSVDSSGNTIVNIVNRCNSKERGDTPAVILNIGTIPDTTTIIQLKINGQRFLNVDGERNVNLIFKSLNLTCNPGTEDEDGDPFLTVDKDRNINLTFKGQTWTGKTVDMSQVTDDYKLP